MITRTCTATLILFLLGLPFVAAQSSPLAEHPPDVPDAIRTPAGTHVVLSVAAEGSQIYVCQAAADGKFGWMLKAPDAELRDRNNKVIGHHSAGPTWTMDDGSSVKGKAMAHVDSSEPDSIQWLLVEVVSHSGQGVLSNVTNIQRVHTHGGKAPAEGCDAAHRDAETKTSYVADYYFYAADSK